MIQRIIYIIVPVMVTAIVLKYCVDWEPEKQVGLTNCLSAVEVDSLLEFSNGIDYPLNDQNWLNLDGLISNRKTCDQKLELFSSGLLALKKYEAYTAAADLLIELQTCLHSEPRIHRFYPVLPVNSKSVEGYPLKLFNFYDYLTPFHLNPNRLLNINELKEISDNYVFDNGNHRLISAAPILRLAHEEYEKAISNLSDFMGGKQLSDNRAAVAAAQLLKLQLLGNNAEEAEKLVNDFSLLSMLQDSLSAEVYNLELVATDLIPLLEYRRIIGQDEAAELIQNIESPYIFEIIQLKRRLFELPDNQLLTRNHQIDLMDDPPIVLSPELVLAKTAVLHHEGMVEEAENLINIFWFITSMESPPRDWWFDNFPAYLLKAFKYAFWDGGRIHLWYIQYRDSFINYGELEPLNETIKHIIREVNKNVKSGSDLEQ